MLRGQYDHTAKIDQLEEAIDSARQAIKFMPQDHPGLSGTLNELGKGLKRRFERMGKLEDLEESIQVSGRAVATGIKITPTPEDHIESALRLSNLGTSSKEV